MSHLIGVLILFLAHGTVVMQPLPTLPGAVCVARYGAPVAQCYRPRTAIKDTSGFVAQRFEIRLRMRPTTRRR